jgi:hypothetical protein
LPVVVVL